jgi:broad specificity phosphatase PhoE
MGHLYLVRHGQASFGADNYDQLSELGGWQSERLGQYFASKGRAFDTVITGSLVLSAAWACRLGNAPCKLSQA